MGTPFVINSLAFDGSVKKSWHCELIERSGNHLIFLGVFDRSIDHSHLGRIEAGTISYEYYWLDRWYNVFRFHELDGSFRNFYCNLNMPPRLNGNCLEYIDLEVDIVIGRDGAPLVLDEEEFEQNAGTYGYPVEVRENVESALVELRDLIEARAYPFDHPDLLEQNPSIHVK